MNETQIDEIIRIIRNKVSSKARLITWVSKNLNLTIPKSTNYKKLIEKIASSGNEKKFSKKMYNLSSFYEIIEKDLIDQGLYAFPKETLILIAEHLSEKKKKWKFTKSNVGDLKTTIIYNTTLKDYEKLLPELIQNQHIPNLIQHYGVVVGPLGITRAKIDRSGYDADDLIEFLSVHVTDTTVKHFQNYADFIPSELVSHNKNRTLVATQQLIVTYGSDEEIKNLFNILIENEIIQINEEEYRSIGIITPCGVVNNNSEDPVKDLASLVLTKANHDALDYHLKEEGYSSGPLEFRLYGKYLMTPPEIILNHEFGMNDLREIGKKLGLIRLEKVIQKDQLIRYLLLALGFTISTEISGISQYIRNLEESQNQCKTEGDSEKLRGLILNVFAQCEKILKDLIYFHIAIFWAGIQEEESNESKLSLARKFIRKELKEKKDFSKPTFGQLVYLMKNMNSYLVENSTRQKKFQEALSRDYVFSPKELEKLIKISESRGQFSHDTSRITHKPLSAVEIIKELISVAKQFESEKIYPVIFRVTREITNEYGISYFEAIGENNTRWNIKTHEWLTPGTIGMMFSSTDKIAVFPFLVTKYW